MDRFDGKPRISGSSAAAGMRAQLRGVQPASQEARRTLPADPPPKRARRDELYEERAERAERLARAQHTTSLLRDAPKKTRYEQELEGENRKGGLVIQLVAVMAICGGVAFALDPALMRHIEPWLATATQQIAAVRAQLGF